MNGSVEVEIGVKFVVGCFLSEEVVEFGELFVVSVLRYFGDE